MPRERVVSSLGSGVIVKPEGTIVTSYHVIEGAEDIVVVLSDRCEFEAKVSVRDEQYDLAVLTVDTKGEQLPSLPLRDSDSLEVGDLVLAIGNPFGVGQTVTHGIVSAIARSSVNVNDFSFFIQTDAAINPGNSGGALVDLQGRLTGIPTAIYTRSGGSNGIGFAIPANMVRAVLAGEQRDGRVIKPWLGASYQPLTLELADSLDLPSPRGVLVGEVYENGPADKGGLHSGDVIFAINDQPVDDVQALRFRTAIAEVGKPLNISIMRDGEKLVLPITLMLPPDKPDRDIRQLKGYNPLKGVTVANLNPALAMELNMNPSESGVVVVLDHFKFRSGDVIISLNGTPVDSTQQLATLLEKPSNAWRIDFKRDDRMLSLQAMQ
jgi:Do/DeqQ family serine protease